MAQNEELPGVEGEGVSAKKIKAVDAAFDELLGARANRMKWGGKEKDAQASLIALMEKHNLTVYMYDDRAYVLADIKKVKLKPKDEEED